ncbi:hypothetical protein T01_13361 [Trichinella spiralis]|uniref:Uncharacterized protein n=1 Tax=Trichinella spiralis TaxID=6334 RepID=A0A0V1BV69_TRISP|nr:hypothetical protein T01_13361 [Trichinella spiralis]
MNNLSINASDSDDDMIVVSVRLHTLLSCISETNTYHCISLQVCICCVPANTYQLYFTNLLTSIFVQYSNDLGI